jgi:hypothetical protein
MSRAGAPLGQVARPRASARHPVSGAAWPAKLRSGVECCLIFDTLGFRLIINYDGMTYFPLTGATRPKRVSRRASFIAIVGLSLGFWAAAWFVIGFLP